jgi:transketolase
MPAPVRARLFAALCRVNVLYMIRRAGSGHIGTSFSCQDVVSTIFLNELRSPDDVFFSSKGHDAPAFYAALTGLGRIRFELLHALRKLGGLPGHPEVHIPEMHANTGSLGMGIAKAKGMLQAARALGRDSRFFVLTGDGELEEGQIWESLPTAVRARMGELTVVVDNNKIQSDTWVDTVTDFRDPGEKFASFGWHVSRVDGHDTRQLVDTFAALREIRDQPKVVIADTTKGKGVSFMEAFGKDDKFYGFHSGAPSAEHYQGALEELLATAEQAYRAAGLTMPSLATHELELTPSAPTRRQVLVEAYGDELVQQAQRNSKLVALDADLIKDCGLPTFAARFPERLLECGIAEQDMVSQAGGLALKGMLPVVHSFSAFLSARPNEQIYTNATEGSKIIYVGTLAGLLPATPGHSHQSVRDISSLGGVPGLVMYAPSSEIETRAAVDWAFNVSTESTYLRLCSIPCAVPYDVASRPQLTVGRGREVFARGQDPVVLFAYGPVLLTQVVLAAQELAQTGVGVRVFNLPWLNRVDGSWLASAVKGARYLITVDDHYVRGGQGELVLATLATQGWPSGLRASSLGITGLPACGQNDEVLAHHGLNGAELAVRIRKLLAAA